MFFTWGADDLYMLEDNLSLHNLSTKWIPEVWDAQITMEDRWFSLSYAIWKFGIKPLSAHDALNDAQNTVEVMRRLDVKDWLREESIEYEGCTPNENII